MKKNISLMIKPSSSMCNMNCAYCFYRSIAENRKDFSHGHMTIDVLNTVIRKALEYAKGGAVSITFQGGEPLLSGKDFFRSVNKAVSEYNVYNSAVMLSLQTNATLLDNEWCEILKDYLIGISLDSSLDEFNALRVNNNGNNETQNIVKKVRLLSENKLEFNVLCVVTKAVADNIEAIFESFVDEGIRYLQFIPCLKPYGKSDVSGDIYLNGEEYGEFLIKLFKLYYRYFTSGRYVSVRLFDNFVRLVAGKNAEQCGVNGYCSKQFVIEGNGDVYPCDFYCLDEYFIGSICDSSFEELESTDTFKSFSEESFKKEDKCSKCDIYRYCRGGGCKRERTDIDICVAYRRFFEESLEELMALTPYC